MPVMFPSVIRSTQQQTEDTQANQLGDSSREILPGGLARRVTQMIDTTVLAAFLEYSPNPTWLADSDGRCIYVNQELKEITGVGATQLGDLSWLELVAEEDRQMSSTLWQEARIHHRPYRARFFLRARDSARGRAADAVGMGHIAPDGSEAWLFTAVVSTPSGKALPRVEANLQMTLNALPTQAWYARASGALAFVSPPRAGIGQNRFKRGAREMTSSAYWEPMENTIGFLRERSLSGIRMARLDIGLA
jgi:PAS domain S-box-containing protein